MRAAARADVQPTNFRRLKAILEADRNHVLWQVGTPLYALAARAEQRHRQAATTPLQEAARWALGCLARVHWSHGWGRPKTPTARATLEAADRQMLETLAAQGYLSSVPKTTDVDEGSREHDSSAHAARGHRGRIFIQSSRLGDVSDAPTGFSEVLIRHPVMARWLVVLHETAHCEFAQVADPFRPGPGHSLDAECVAALNRWTLGPVVPDAAWRLILNESFADVYSAMLLLKVTDFDPQAHAVLDSLQAARRATRTADESLAAFPEAADPHHTDLALSRLLAHTEDWRHEPPDRWLSLALGYASDGLLDLVDPQVHSAAFSAVIRERRFQLGSMPVCSSYPLRSLVIDTLCDVPLEQTLLALDGHPMTATVRRMASALRPVLEELPGRARADYRWCAQHMVIDGLTELLARAARTLVPIAQAALSDSPRLARAYQRDRQTVAEGLALEHGAEERVDHGSAPRRPGTRHRP